MREHLQPAEEGNTKFLSTRGRRGLEKEHCSWEKLPVAGMSERICVRMQRDMGAAEQ